MPSIRVGKARESSEIASQKPIQQMAEAPNPTSSDAQPSVRFTRATHDARVDDVLETLQRSLKDQETVQRMLEAVRRPEREPSTMHVLSGATAPRKPARRPTQPLVRKNRAQRRPVKESRAISSVRCLVAAAESLGLDMSAAKGLIISSERKLARRKQREAAGDAAKALVHARHASAVQLQTLVVELEAKVRNLTSNGGRSLAAERAIDSAKASLKKRNYRTAIAAVAGARKMLSDAETALIRKILLESKEKFVSAKRAGANTDTAVIALMKAKENLRKGDLAAAVRMARRAESAVEVTMAAHHDASRRLAALARALAVAEQVDAEVADHRRLLAQSKALFEDGAYFKSSELSRDALAGVDSSLQGKIQEALHRAETAVSLAKEGGATVPSLDARLDDARAKVNQREYIKSMNIANQVLVDATSEVLTAMRDRIGGIGQFAKSVAGEIDSLSQVQDAIVHSRERGLEMARKYSSMSEDIVSQAYDNAAAYMRVSQDIVKQAYESSIGVDPESVDLELEPKATAPRSGAAAQILGIASNDRKLRIIDLYLSGRIDDKQLDRLLALVDSNSSGIEISDEVQEADFAKQ